jgi:phosphate-selective porin OprO/OprP
MKKFKLVLAALLILAATAPTGSWASDSSADIVERLQRLEQEIAVLKRQLEVKKEVEDKKVAESPIITANSKDGFSVKSPDDSFKLKVGGLIQTDGRFFTDNKKNITGTTDTFSVRRARIIFSGTVGKSFDYYIVPDFGAGNSTLVDAYADFKISPAWKIRGGKFKVPLGLERFQADPVANFTESGLPSNFLPNREVGFQLFGDLLGESVNYSVGLFNGTVDAASSTAQDVDNNNDKDVIARVFVHPFKHQGPESLKGFGVGLGGSYGHREGATTSSAPGYKSAGQATIFSYSAGNFDGPQTRLSPQAYFYKGAFGLIGEYAVSHQKLARISGPTTIRDTFDNRAWQLTGNYVLTGELTSFKGITPRTNFDLEKGTWGAFEVVGRVEHLSIDNSIFDNGFASLNTVVSGADAFGVGLNWYPHKNFKLALDFEQTRFDRGATAGNDRPIENVVLTRFQVVY